MTDYQDLISRLEKAKGPNYALDKEIWDLVVEPFPESYRLKPPAYTASLDAAVGLVPEKAKKWSVSGGLDGKWGATVDLGFSHGLVGADFKGHTPAIALCIACLKARHHSAS